MIVPNANRIVNRMVFRISGSWEKFLSSQKDAMEEIASNRERMRSIRGDKRIGHNGARYYRADLGSQLKWEKFLLKGPWSARRRRRRIFWASGRPFLFERETRVMPLCRPEPSPFH